MNTVQGTEPASSEVEDEVPMNTQSSAGFESDFEEASSSRKEMRKIKPFKLSINCFAIQEIGVANLIQHNSIHDNLHQIKDHKVTDGHSVGCMAGKEGVAAPPDNWSDADYGSVGEFLSTYCLSSFH